MPGRVGDSADVVATVEEVGVDVVAVVTASQNAARPGSAEHAPQVLGSPVQTGSAAGASETTQSFLPPLLFELVLRDSGREMVAEVVEGRGGEGDAGCATVYQSLVVLRRRLSSATSLA